MSLDDAEENAEDVTAWVERHQLEVLDSPEAMARARDALRRPTPSPDEVERLLAEVAIHRFNPSARCDAFWVERAASGVTAEDADAAALLRAYEDHAAQVAREAELERDGSLRRVRDALAGLTAEARADAWTRNWRDWLSWREEQARVLSEVQASLCERCGLDASAFLTPTLWERGWALHHRVRERVGSLDESDQPSR